MAETVGDVIGRGWAAGRGIGRDFASWKYNRGEAKLRQQVEEEAAAAGMSVAEYINADPRRLEQIEQQLTSLYTTSGAAKRGVTGAGGAALYEDSVGRLRNEFTTGANRAVARQELDRDFGGAMGTQAGAAASLGDVGVTRASTLAQDQIANSTAAIAPDGTFNAPQAMQANAIAIARRGDTAGAAQGQQQARDMRYQFASQHGGELLAMVQNPGLYGTDAIVGKANALLGMTGELGSGLSAQADEKGDVWLSRNGVAYVPLLQGGSVTEEALGALNKFVQDPAGSVQAQVKQLADQSAAEQKDTRELRNKFVDAVLDIAKEASKVGGKEAGAAITSLGKSTQKAAAEGWSFSDLEGGGKIMENEATGQLFVLQQNEPGATNAMGLPLPPVQVLTMDGQPVSDADLRQAPAVNSVVQDTIKLQTVGAQLDLESRRELLNMGLGIIGELGQGLGLDVNVRAPGGRQAPASDVESIQRDYRELGDQFGFKITSMERGVLNVGAGARSQHPKGTAVDYSVKGKSKEEGDRLIAALQARGYEVVDERDGRTGTGPHIHAEIPPGGLAPNNSPVATGALDVTQPQARTSPVDVPGRAVSQASDGVKPPPRRAIANTNPLKDAEALRARRTMLEESIAEFQRTEQRAERPAMAGFGSRDPSAYSPYGRGQQQVLTEMQTELERVKAAEQQALAAARKASGAAMAGLERSRVAQRYGLPEANPETSAALARWAR